MAATPDTREPLAAFFAIIFGFRGLFPFLRRTLVEEMRWLTIIAVAVIGVLVPA